MADTADRTLPATPRRREAARRQGAMPAADLPAWAAAIGTAVALLPAWGQATMPAAVELFRTAITGAAAAQLGRPLDVSAPLADMPLAVVLPTCGLVLVSAAAGLAVRFVLDGFSWEPARAVPDLARVNPLNGARRIFSRATAAAVIGNGISLTVLAAAAWLGCGPLLAVLGGPAAEGEPVAVFAAARHTLLWLAAAAAIVAACQWSLQRLRFERRIRMTAEEFTEEARSMQADPKIRLMHQRRRQVAGTS